MCIRLTVHGNCSDELYRHFCTTSHPASKLLLLCDRSQREEHWTTMIDHAVILCVAAVAVTCGLAAKCPERCQCVPGAEGYREAVGCAHQHRSTIPADFPPNTEYIKYEGNSLMELTRDFTFPMLPKLRRLDLHSGTLRKIGADAFRNLPKLEVLYLNDNAIQTIEADAFRGLSSLRLLDLRGNKLAELPDSAFNGLNLETLRLTNNRIITIGNDTFKGATVHTLELSGNAIWKLPANALLPLRSNLTKLIWNNNAQPLKIARTAFKGVHLFELSLVNSSLHSDTSFLQHVNAKTLDLSGNQLSPSSLNLSKYTSMQSVLNLRMRNMSLTAISAQLLPKSRWLREIDLTGNKLTVVSGDSFKWVTSLETIRLDGNLLTRLPERLAEVVPGLLVLRVLGNRITNLDASTLAPFIDRSLRTLDISSNRIQTFHKSLRPLLSKIDIFANGNPLHCNCELLWYREWLNGPGMSGHGLYDLCKTPVEDYIVYLPESSFACTAPRIVNVTPSKQVNEGDEVFLTCSAVADPAPEVEWTAPSGEAISITPSQDRTRNRTMAVWRLSSAITPQQAGIYTCTASNLRGNVSVSICVGVRTPGSARTVCDVTAPVTAGPPKAATTVSRTETTSATTPSARVTRTHDDVIASSSASFIPTGADTTVVQQRVTTDITVVQPGVTTETQHAITQVNSRDSSITALDETTTDSATHWTENVGLPDTANQPRPSADQQASSGGWVTAVVICVVIVVVVVAVVALLFYVRRRRFSRSTYLSTGTDDKSTGNKNMKVVDTEIALIPRMTANDKPEKDAMLLNEENGNAVEKAGQEETIKTKSNANAARDSAVLLSDLENNVVTTQSSAEQGITGDTTSLRQAEGYSGPLLSNPAFVLSPGSYSTETSVDEIHKDNKGQSPEDNCEQQNVEKRNKPAHTFIRSFSANPEGGTSLSAGRLSRGETEA